MRKMSRLVVVFVYLNVDPPKYLLENLRRINFYFSHLEILYVTNIEVNIPEDINAKIIKIDTRKYNDSFTSHSLSKSFRNGFWQASLLRLLVLQDIHELFPDTSILHFEADVLVMPDFPLEKISMVEKLMWMEFNNELDVGAILYSPTKAHTIMLCNFILKDLNKNDSLTDMRTLSNFRHVHPAEVVLFPSHRTDELFLFFECLFDGAIYGMWLLGQDQRNHFGKLLRFRDLEESNIKVGDSSFLMQDNVLWLVNKKFEPLRLVNLHVHCKDSRIFAPKNEFLGRRVLESRAIIRVPVFSLKILVELLVAAFHARQLLSTLSFFPVIGRVLRIAWRIFRRLNRFQHKRLERKL